MDEYKFKPLEDWLRRVKEADCDSFFVMATNNKNKIVYNCQCDCDTFASMLLIAARQDKETALAIVSAAAIINKRQEEKQRDCSTCEHAGSFGVNDKVQVAEAHCILHRKIHRLPHGCDDWQQRERGRRSAMKKLVIYCEGNNDCCDIIDKDGNSYQWDELTAEEQRSLLNAMSNIYGTLEVNCKDGGE